jgi:hypothetical protein
MLLRLQWTAYNDRNGTYVPSIGEVYHTIMKRGYEINSGKCHGDAALFPASVGQLILTSPVQDPVTPYYALQDSCKEVWGSATEGLTICDVNVQRRCT